jgi:chemotaxis-related protein WspD
MTFHKIIDDCWNKIDFRSGQTCDNLREYAHCRNCPVYSEAARNIMERPVPAGYQREWAEHFSRDESIESATDESAVVFRVGHEWLALPTTLFVTVAEKVAAHRLPHRSGPGLTGIVNVGGKLFPCMDLAELMTIDLRQPYQQAGRHAYPRLIVVRLGPHACAIPVDDLHRIEHYNKSELQAPPATVNKGVARYLTGVLSVEDRRIGCLDAELLGYQMAKILR